MVALITHALSPIGAESDARAVARGKMVEIFQPGQFQGMHQLTRAKIVTYKIH